MTTLRHMHHHQHQHQHPNHQHHSTGSAASPPPGSSPPGFTVTIVACGWVRGNHHPHHHHNGGGNAPGGTEGGMVYAVAVSQPVQSWTVLRHHDEFWAMGTALTTLLAQQHAHTAPPSLPPCPTSPFAVPNNTSCNNGSSAVSNSSDSSALSMVQARNELQEWLSTLLLYPVCRDSTAIRNFLTVGANTILPEYEGVQWTQFTTALLSSAAAAVAAASTTATAPSAVSAANNITPPAATVSSPTQQGIAVNSQSHSHHNHHQHAAAAGNNSGRQQQQQQPLDDMEMDDMFLVDDLHGGDGNCCDDDDDCTDDCEDDDTDHYCTVDQDDTIERNHNHQGTGGNLDRYDEDYIPSASLRYQQTNEAVTDEDEFDILQAGDIEMIEDIGSLAQSLGASHLGRSLNLQKQQQQKNQHQQMKQGLMIGGSSHHHNNNNNNNTIQQTLAAAAGGGIGCAMAQAAGCGGLAAAAAGSGAGTGYMKFNDTPTQSAPRLDSFKMMKVIGKGSFGKVFLVREIKTGQVYALKVLRKDNIIKRNQVEHTKTERSVLGYVKHPFIVGMNMAFQSKDKLYFVLDYCAGGELFFHLGKEGRFLEPRARFYAAEIILAISYVHSLDIIYRDLKPENVLLDSAGHIRLTDFGLSKEGISNSSSGANSFCGTPEYLAPEILNRQGHGRAVDWWSLGALLYEMLTGLPPFYCQDRERLFEKIRKSELSYPASVSRPAVSMLKGLLMKDPTRRLGSGPTDDAEIRQHEFFASIHWEKLFHGEIPPPWCPKISGLLDVSQFDKEFTNMPIFSPAQRGHGFGQTPNDSHFEGFTFTDSIFHGPGAAAATATQN